VDMRVSACSFATPFSTPLEHRGAVRTSGGRIVLLGKRSGYRLNSLFYGLLTVFIASLLVEPTLVQLPLDSVGLHSHTESSRLVDLDLAFSTFALWPNGRTLVILNWYSDPRCDSSLLTLRSVPYLWVWAGRAYESKNKATRKQ
jgi:hypothetical protein